MAKSFVSIEHLSGEKGKTGATSRLIYKMGKREIEMIETITFLDRPEAFHLTFDVKNVYNVQENYFEGLPNDATKCISENEFKFSGFMKLMGLLMPGAFKKQSLAYMEGFKTFPEEEKSVLDAWNGLIPKIWVLKKHILERKLKLIWDFRGPSASNTAKHHEIHLKEYIVSEKLSLNLTGHLDINDMHSIAYMIVTDSEMKPVRDALKPHRGQLYEE